MAARADAIYRIEGRSLALVARAPDGVEFAGRQVADSTGAIWAATQQHGIARVHNGRVETLLAAGDPGGAVNAVFLDREENIWVGSSSGLHRFRKPHARLLPSVGGHDAFAPADGVRRLARQRLGRRRDTRRGADQPDTRRTSFLRWIRAARVGRGPRGAHLAWYERRPLSTRGRQPSAGARRKWRRAQERQPVPDRCERQLVGTGHLRWHLSTHARPTAAYLSRPEYLIRLSDVGTAGHVAVLASRTWRAATAARWHVDTDTRLPTAARVAVHWRSSRAATRSGSATTMGSRAGATANGRDGPPTWTAEWGRRQEIINDDRGRLWLMTYGGIVALRAADLEATPDGQPSPLRFVHIGALDRVVAHPGTLIKTPRASMDRRGRIYFATYRHRCRRRSRRTDRLVAAADDRAGGRLRRQPGHRPRFRGQAQRTIEVAVRLHLAQPS